jgi:hypothetical protein
MVMAAVAAECTRLQGPSCSGPRPESIDSGFGLFSFWRRLLFTTNGQANGARRSIPTDATNRLPLAGLTVRFIHFSLAARLDGKLRTRRQRERQGERQAGSGQCRVSTVRGSGWVLSSKTRTHLLPQVVLATQHPRKKRARMRLPALRALKNTVPEQSRSNCLTASYHRRP